MVGQAPPYNYLYSVRLHISTLAVGRDAIHHLHFITCDVVSA